MDYKIHLQIFQGTFYNTHLTIEIIIKVKIMEYFFNQVLSSIYNNVPVNDLTCYMVLLYDNKLNIVPFQNCFPRLLYQLFLLKSSDGPVGWIVEIQSILLLHLPNSLKHG